jgi:hypothetical protein
VGDVAALKARIEEEGIQFVDFRVSDLVGRLRHISIPVERFDERLVDEGIGFDGSNYGFCGVSGSDMVLVPDLGTAYVEERDGGRILVLMADVSEAATRSPSAYDPRRIAAAAVEFLRSEGIADDVLVSPESDTRATAVGVPSRSRASKAVTTERRMSRVVLRCPRTTPRWPKTSCSLCGARCAAGLRVPGFR